MYLALTAYWTRISVTGQKTLFKDVLMGIPKSDLLGVTVVLIHVANNECYKSVMAKNGYYPSGHP